EGPVGEKGGRKRSRDRSGRHPPPRAMTWRRTLVRVAEVREGEGRIVIALAGLNFLIVLAYTLARVARDGLLLSRLPARGLPYVYVALAAFTLLVSAGAGRLTGRASAA